MLQIRAHRQRILLLVALAALVAESFSRGNLLGQIALEVLGYALLVVVFLTIFERKNERRFALVVGAVAIVSNVLVYSAEGALKLAALLTFHAVNALFLGWAVLVILRGVFRSRNIGTEQILGGCAGYLLAGIAWANLYLFVDFATPHAFNIAGGLTGQLADAEPRRFLFIYFSFITLSSVGFGDITPLAPPACMLAWTEAVFGQFYMAVLVGQLVGMKLSQSPRAEH